VFLEVDFVYICEYSE